MNSRAAGMIAASLLVLICAVVFIAPLFGMGDGISQDRASAFAPPSHLHWLGTDGLGRDEFARLLSGTRISLLAGALATLVALSVGLAAGVIAGYYGGWKDEVITGIVELFQSLPWFYFVLALRAFLPLTLPEGKALLSIALIAGFTGWPRPSRLIRGMVVAEKRRDYVTAARGFHAGDFYLMRRHILPSVYGVMLVQAVLLIPQFILAEVTLSFLGLGVGEPAASLGAMLAGLRDPHVLTSFPWMLSPAALLILVIGFCQITAKMVRELCAGIH